MPLVNDILIVIIIFTDVIKTEIKNKLDMII